MPLIFGTNSIKDTGFNVANSLRFDGADHLVRSKGGSETGLTKGTFSFWVKRTNIDGSQHFLYSNTVADTNNRGYISWRDSEKIRIITSTNNSSELILETSQLFRDPSAWSHIVYSIDTTQSTAANRAKLYVNGTQVTSFSTDTYMDQNSQCDIFEGGQTNKEFIGGLIGNTSNLHSYLSEYVYIDGLALAPTDFGEFDEDSGIWKPIDVSGLTFGTNGFYLEFKQAGTGTNASGMGADTSGNTNHFAVTNLTAVDQSTDTCTNNFATLNPLDVYASKTGVLSEGNLKLTATASQLHTAVGTIAPSNGKWYLEVELDAISSSNNSNVGISDLAKDDKSNMPSKKTWGYGYNPDGTKQNNGSDSSYGNSYTAGDIIGVAMDLDNGAVYFSKNGTFQASGDPTSGASKTNAAFTWTPDASMNWVPYVADNTSGVAFTWITNFGSPPTAISSSNADGNGFGNFEFAVPSGYFALNTKNLAENG